MLDPATWTHHAAGLPLGRSIRVNHVCGPGRTLKISRDGNGILAYCFRCNDTGRSEPPAESLEVRLAALAAYRNADAACSVLRGLPEPACLDVDLWPDRARLWFYKAGLGRAEIGRLGAYYHPPSGRVVVPLLDPSTGLPAFFVARALTPGQLPKYLAPDVSKDQLLPRWGEAETPTLTEDVLSAFKVGLVAEGIALLGTRIPAKVMQHLMQRKCSVNVWLDPDPAGQRGAAKIIKQLRAYGIPCRNIVSQHDPKLHTRQQIKELLCLDAS